MGTFGGGLGTQKRISYKDGGSYFGAVVLEAEKMAPRHPQVASKGTKVEAQRPPRNNEEGIGTQNLENLKNDDVLN